VANVFIALSSLLLCYLQVLPVVINFSAQTSSLDTQQTIEGKLEKKRKTLLGAPTGKQVRRPPNCLLAFVSVLLG
jgi:hypothetical protein